MDKHQLSFIVATKDRPRELTRMLDSLQAQSCLADQIIIVDSGQATAGQTSRPAEWPAADYVRFFPPSASRQRNAGLDLVRPGMTLVGFIDDDVVLEPQALETMIRFWAYEPETTAGAAFNMFNHPPLYASRLKTSSLSKRLGLYSDEIGRVLPSGFQTMIGRLTKNVYVHWLPSTAVVWRRRVFDEFRFDEWFQGYSYLEDLDFGYRVGKNNRLAVVADALYNHFPAPSGRGNQFAFGRREVRNRIYFVKKHRELSLSRCYLALLLRLSISLILPLQERKQGGFARAMGNVLELSRALLSI